MAAPSSPLLPNDCRSFSPSSDPVIKLFGKTILLPAPSFNSLDNLIESKSLPDAVLSPRRVDELGFSSGNSSGSDDEDLPTLPKEKVELRNPKQEAEGAEEDKNKQLVDGTEDKILRKPDKPVPCPRCDSLDTKFCYFNNYNINQPRHFCRNCQRYWTAGGTLRNVPVGAGRRKNKHASQHKQLLPDTAVIRTDDPEGAQALIAIPQVPTTKSPVIRISPVETGFFSSTSPASSCISSVRQETSLQGDMASNFILGGSFPGQETFKPGETDTETRYGMDPLMASQVSNPTRATAEGTTGRKDECGSSVTCSGSDTGSDATFEDGNLTRPLTGTEYGSAFPFFGMPWPYMYMNWADAAGAAAVPAPLPSGSSIWPHGAATRPPAANASVWGGSGEGLWQWPSLPGAAWTPGWNSPPWSFAWGLNASAAAAAAAAASIGTVGVASGINELGKRPRATSEGTGDGSLCIPKTLRIHDPGEAARSFILTTFGVDNKSGSLTSGGIFNAFQRKAEVFRPKPGSKLFEERHANPAAMSRSMAFQENNKGL